MGKNMEVTEIEIGVIKYFITECPSRNQLDEFKNIMVKNNVDILIRILEPSKLYNIDIKSLKVIDFTDFKDGSVPTKDIMERYIKMIEEFKRIYKNPKIAIHCVSSLGRCPTFLGISMIIEDPKMDRYKIIMNIREIRPGALNTKQVNWLIDLKVSVGRNRWKFKCCKN